MKTKKEANASPTDTVNSSSYMAATLGSGKITPVANNAAIKA